jgi:hypothetical protein
MDDPDIKFISNIGISVGIKALCTKIKIKLIKPRLPMSQVVGSGDGAAEQTANQKALAQLEDDAVERQLEILGRSKAVGVERRLTRRVLS